jgi:hypothetical protein
MALLDRKGVPYFESGGASSLYLFISSSHTSNGTKQNFNGTPPKKVYAKAHGSYKAISGGEIKEAFLDLTGAPVYTIGH